MARLLASVLLLLLTVAVGAGPSAHAAGCLLPPVDAPVERGFEAPPCPYCGGHRGVTFAVAPGTPVRAAASGTVTFSGVVVKVRYVVVRHGDGLLATYGALTSSQLAAGDVIAAGATVGRSSGQLYFGLRSGPDTYVDPEPRLGVLVVPPYLVPIDGTGRRRAPSPGLECPRASATAPPSR